MANFDTAQKRYSGVGWDLPWPTFLPIPDGTLNAADRSHLLRKYAGISWSATAGPAYGVDDLTTMVSLYFTDTLYAQAGYLNEDYRFYLDDLRQTVDRNDLNSEQWVDLKV